MKNVCVIGMGYIGLPTGVLLANRDYNVHGVDVSPDVVAKLNSGQIHITEPNLQEYFTEALNKNKLTCSLEPKASDVFLICVPTPFNSDKSPNLDYIQQACKNIAPHLTGGELIILESTSPVGASEKAYEWLLEFNPKLKDSKVHMAYCPERVLPGKILDELINNDRVVGGVTNEATTKAKTFYEGFVKGAVLATNSKTAELCKLVENSFRDVNIAFANELSMISDQLGVNVWELIELANRHPRVNILKPGPGVGGHCIAVDPWFIVSSCPEYSPLIKTARNVNDSKPEFVKDQIRNQFSKDTPISLLGISFKENIDDLRESPSKAIALDLIREGFKVDILEPNVDELPAEFDQGDFKLINKTSYTSHIADSKQILILVKHQEFKELNLKNSKAKLINSCGLSL